jgi:ketosteroid isomerase-like protein
MKGWMFALVPALALAAGPREGAKPETPTAETLKALEGSFMKATAEQGSAGYLSFYSESAVELPNGGDPVEGKAAIAKTMGFLDEKQNHLTWSPVGADIAASGDLGYTWGTYEFQGVAKDGKPVLDRGKYMTVWKKQSDGTWKVALDMGNASRAK